jgi:hypothetical protein
VWHDIAHWLAFDSVSDDFYAAWSSSLSVFVPPLLTVFGIAVVAWYHTRCHSTWCFRRAKYDAGPHKGCWKCAQQPKRVKRHHIRAHIDPPT